MNSGERLAVWARNTSIRLAFDLVGAGALPVTSVAAAAALSRRVAPAAHVDELADVRATVELEEKLFLTRDVTLAPRVFAPDVIWQTPFGVRFHGEAELEAFLTRLFKRPGYLAGQDTTRSVVTDVKLLGPTSATAWEQDVFEGEIDDATGKPIGVRKSHTLYVLQKRGAVWQIVDEMIMDEHVR